MVKVAIIGVGKMGQRHLENWLQISNIDVVGIVGRDLDKLKRLAETYNTTSYLDIRSLLEDQKVEIVDICLPTFLHYEAMKEVIGTDEKVSIVCEKPLCLNEDEAKAILQLSKEKDIQILVGHTLRFDPEYAFLRQQIKQGVVGEVGVVRLSRKTSFPGRWFRDNDKSGGILLDLGIHDLDWLLWTFGDVERVLARHIKQKDDREFDYALIILRMKNGVIVHLELSWGESSLKSSFEIAGKEGLLVGNSDSKEPIQIATKQPNQSSDYLPKELVTESAIYKQLSHFKDCIVNGASPIISIEEAVKAVELAQATIFSARNGVPVYLAEEEVQE
ncbi:hypothetical protein DLJ74_05095 [Gracilibacillus dipsosauri]|uniref:Gfo/Idh/MocA family oxidoreductase n=1 Tax=Gracilibacillus dipsosauri TaxID=178340 RepID=A0A317L2Y5_9BACI|nr:hypothetical protein DLJ74_05095 [Gracilibacillus dipsosauri]